VCGMSFFQKILSVLFPDRCVGCETLGALVCAECAHTLPPASSPERDFITSVFAYRDPRIRILVRMLKYKNTRHAADVFAPALAGVLTEFLGEEGMLLGGGDVILVPVPLSRKRKKTRGYNQAELLARATLALMPGVRIRIDTNLLEKTVDTKQQADITKRSERLQNLGDCFRVVSGRTSSGETVLLLDDVTTTGATIMAARKALRAAGFHKVYAITVAH
jgi:competence protein ComFC